MEKKITSPVVAGITISLILIVLSIVTYFTGLYTKTWSQYCGFVILLGGILWAVVNNSNEKNHDVTFGNLFGYGFKVTAVIICLVILYSILSGYLFPDVKQKIMELAKQQALARPGADEDQVEKGMEMFEKNYTLFIVIGIIFWYIVIGVIASLIGAAVSKKNPSSEFENQL
jgi:Protein of unknown function (DUF4199)